MFSSDMEYSNFDADRTTSGLQIERQVRRMEIRTFLVRFFPWPHWEQYSGCCDQQQSRCRALESPGQGVVLSDGSPDPAAGRHAAGTQGVIDRERAADNPCWTGQLHRDVDARPGDEPSGTPECQCKSRHGDRRCQGKRKAACCTGDRGDRHQLVLRHDALKEAVAHARDESPAPEAGQQNAVDDWPALQLVADDKRQLAKPNRVDRTTADLISKDIAVKRRPSWIAVVILSRGRGEARTCHLVRQMAPSGVRSHSAAKVKAVSGPKNARITPPRAGPTLRTMLYPTDVSVTAAGMSRLCRISPMEACQAGSFKAKPQPARKPSPRMSQGLINPSPTEITSVVDASANRQCPRKHHPSAAEIVRDGAGKDRQEEHRQCRRSLHQGNHQVGRRNCRHQPTDSHGLHEPSETGCLRGRPDRAKRGIPERSQGGRNTGLRIGMLHFVVSLSNSQGVAATQQNTHPRASAFAVSERIAVGILHWRATFGLVGLVTQACATARAYRTPGNPPFTDGR